MHCPIHHPWAESQFRRTDSWVQNSCPPEKMLSVPFIHLSCGCLQTTTDKTWQCKEVKAARESCLVTFWHYTDRSSVSITRASIILLRQIHRSLSHWMGESYLARQWHTRITHSFHLLPQHSQCWQQREVPLCCLGNTEIHSFLLPLAKWASFAHLCSCAPTEYQLNRNSFAACEWSLDVRGFISGWMKIPHHFSLYSFPFVHQFWFSASYCCWGVFFLVDLSVLSTNAAWFS